MSSAPAPNTGITISGDLVDQIASLLVWLQNEDPSRILTHLAKMREACSNLQGELQKIRGPWVVCHICQPSKRIKMEEIYKHDTEVHHAYRSR